MSHKPNYFLTILNVISWIIFVGLCFEAGAFIVTTVLTLFLSPENVKKLWTQVNLSDLHNFNQTYYVIITCIMIIVAVLKALMFYIIVRIFNDKKFNIAQPFNETIRIYILKIAYLALGIGLFSFWGAGYAEGFMKEGVNLPDIQHLRFGGADVWVFMGITLLVISQILKKGIELQNENDLTI